MQRRTTLLALVAGLATAIPMGAAAAAPSAPESPRPTPPSAPAATTLGDALTDAGAARGSAAATPRTPFETSNGAQWSTFEQWQGFWRALDADNDRVRITEVGRSGQDRPIDLIAIGAPAPRSQSAAANGSVILYNCSIHGDEPSGREACMTFGRDLATSRDARVERFLRQTTVLFVNINPDGWIADTRQNGANVDVNRDFLELATSEGRVLATLIRDWQPDVLNDLHEYAPREFYDAQATTLWPRNRNVDDGVHALGKSMVLDYTGARIVAAGMTNAIYGHLNKEGRPFRQVAGDGQARILRNYSGLRHIVGQLTEAACR
ncbi:hypothetical protein BJY21_001239 [Kineosphaera limosa]|uniref:Peptidase M14 domain-containing protein n=1 Tax=Kineosphaera limosa NBRC 100340 TaxID=1184609 RepID=K6WPM5_9MICO|nr:M14 family zinc carboxypeptidase [Kineosphaera limosa]NYE00055.1 hypothetical protein [Kineosphaera limosa]GAB95771.1 hypothetical protein KILIM_026_00420 [Kineosphaera limosa NBRC 100340]